jgi:predicted NBD/HSP70 family sugar kinase
VCVDIGASYVRVGLAEGGRVLSLVECRIPDLLAQYQGDIVLAVAELIAPMCAIAPIGEGVPPPIGVGVPAIVFEDGSLRIGLASGIPGGGALRDRLSERFATQVVVDNDASLAALGETLYGAGQGERNVALLTLGTNIGMGVVADGRIYRGAHGAAGEIGNVPLRLGSSDTRQWELVVARRRESPHPSYPADGYVWLEELYGGQALVDAWRARNARGAAEGSSSTTKVFQLAAAGDTVADELVQEAISGWALAIATTCEILDPGVVLIGGGIAADLPPHLKRLRQAIEALMPDRAPRTEIAALGPLAGLIGAAAAARLASLQVPPATMRRPHGPTSSS